MCSEFCFLLLWSKILSVATVDIVLPFFVFCQASGFFPRTSRQSGKPSVGQCCCQSDESLFVSKVLNFLSFISLVFFADEFLKKPFEAVASTSKPKLRLRSRSVSTTKLASSSKLASFRRRSYIFSLRRRSYNIGQKCLLSMSNLEKMLRRWSSSLDE